VVADLSSYTILVANSGDISIFKALFWMISIGIYSSRLSLVFLDLV